MSAGGAAVVRSSQFPVFWAQVQDYLADPSIAPSQLITLRVNGDDRLGWQFASQEYNEDGRYYDIILRRRTGSGVPIAEYVRLEFSDDGHITRFIQYVLIQNDDNYIGRGKDRFDALRM